MPNSFTRPLQHAVTTAFESAAPLPLEVVDIWGASARDRHVSCVTFSGKFIGSVELIVSTAALDAITTAMHAKAAQDSPALARQALDEIARRIADALIRELALGPTVIHPPGFATGDAVGVGPLVAHVRFLSSPGCVEASLRLANARKRREG